MGDLHTSLGTVATSSESLATVWANRLAGRIQESDALILASVLSQLNTHRRISTPAHVGNGQKVETPSSSVHLMAMIRDKQQDKSNFAACVIFGALACHRCLEVP
jgi:hypothetical protein